MKNKKIQAIIIASAMTVNLVMPATSAFADELGNKSNPKTVAEDKSVSKTTSSTDLKDNESKESTTKKKDNTSTENPINKSEVDKKTVDEKEITYKPGWNKIGDYTYYIDNEGNKKTGLQTIGHAKFYFGEDGRLRTGWQNIGDGRYYFWEANQKAKWSGTPVGAMATDNWIPIDGVHYSFNSNGKLKIKDEVKIKDINLKHELNKKLGEEDLDAPITKSQLSKLEGSLELYYKNITDIDGLQYCNNVNKIDLNGNNISDLSPLKGLKNLKWLNIANNKVSSLNELKDLSNLNWLDFDNTNIEDLNPINGLTNLDFLSFNNAKVKDISAINELTKLQSIIGNNNNIKDISVLNNLKGLKTIKLENQTVTLEDITGSNNNFSVENKVKGLSDKSIVISDISNKGVYKEDTNTINWNTTLDKSSEAYKFSQSLLQGKFSGQVKVILKVDEEKKLDASINEEINKTDINNVNDVLSNEDLSKNVNKKEFISRIGIDSLNGFKNIDAAHKNFINWLLNNNEAMEYYLTGGLPSTTTQGSMGAYHYDNNLKVNKEKEISALEVWSKIWNSDNESKDGMNLKIAIATALEFASPVNTWLTDKPLDPISRYNSFKDANKEGILFPCFKDLSIKDLRNVVNAKITDEDIIWLRQYVKDLTVGKEDAKFKWQHEHVHNPDLLSQDKIANICSTLQYTMKNPDGKSVFGSGFYDENPNISKVVEYGGVCGAISKFSTAACQVFGVPAYPIGQPGHCAFLHLNSKNNWQLGYDVFGWEKSGGYYTAIPYMLINEELNLSANQDSYIKSEQLRMIAKNANSKEKAESLLNEAIRIESINYMAFEDKINNMLKDENTTLEQYRELNTQIINNFKKYPQVMENLLIKIREKVLNGDRKEVQAYVNEYEPSLRQVSDYREKPYANKLLSEMEQKGLYLATFNFDGDNAGKLVGLKKGIDEYSIDGGKTYKLANEDSQKLTEKEISSLTSENGILVRVKGTETPNIIQIKKGSNINISINDDENLIFGLDKTMEFSKDEGETWTQYDGTNLGDLSKNVTLLIRKKATGDTLSGGIATVKFTDKEAPKGLILHKYMKVKAFSSEQNNSDQSANMAIDGNENTIWHTKWDRSDKTPFITIELNKEYDITKLSYTPRQSGNYNGNILEYNIYTSLDGENYTKVKSGSWQSNREVKFADFKQTKAKYVKLEVVNGVNGFASASDISLYTE